MDCIYIAGRISAIGDGTLPAGEYDRVAVHVTQCEKCQQLIALRVTSWEQDHELAQPPTIIARWRALAVYLLGNKDSANRAQLEANAREGWSLDDIQERALRRWLEVIGKQAQAVGGFSPGFDG